MNSQRHKAVAYAIQRMHCPYVWFGKGKVIWTPSGLTAHPWSEEVFDCSGLVTAAFFYATSKDLRPTHAANTMWRQFKPSDVPGMASVACYGTANKCTHVMLHVCDGLVVGASGGDSTILSPMDADQRADETDRKCEVTVFTSHLYRSDFLGWRELPFT